IFSDFLAKYPKHHLADDAAYWIGMAWSFDKQFEKCRAAMDDYLKSNPKGRYRGAATYRKAYCAQQMDKYGTAIDELHEYLERFPGEPENNEARVLLGNALMNEGFMDDAFSVFRAIPSTDKKLYEEAVFRTAEGLKAMEQYDKFRALMQEFITKNPQSPRIAEAIGHLGWYFRQKDQPDKAREIYWKAILDHGNNPEIVSILQQAYHYLTTNGFPVDPHMNGLITYDYYDIDTAVLVETQYAEKICDNDISNRDYHSCMFVVRKDEVKGDHEIYTDSPGMFYEGKKFVLPITSSTTILRSGSQLYTVQPHIGKGKEMSITFHLDVKE
ncbi:MAG: hypothetical protein EBU34_13540, partial [Alphaproteobacteria bacterium]|nr:hypothetical protein [Alphaproteobacteria bacterium]